MSGLKRHILLFPLILYGVGDILGSGIYGLIGKVAGQMGNLIWLAFLVSFLVALTTGLSYAALASRHPRAAGSSFMAWKAFGSPMIAFVIGLATLCSGLTSMAAASRIFAGYLTGMAEMIPVSVAVGAFAVLLTLIVFVGIRESLWVNALCTLIELGGLTIVIIVGLPYLGSVNLLDATSIPDGVELTGGLVLSGAVLAFYSFVGFEDLLNVSEEVVKPERTVPLALVISMLVASSIYMLVAVVAVSVIPASELATSGQPLVDVVQKAWPSFPTQVFSIVALFAVANTALLNYIMSSRLIYGLANLGLLPRVLGKVHSTRKTPFVAILLVAALFLALAYLGEVATLARATSLFVLLVFFTMNVSLFVFQRKDHAHKGWRIPQFVPVLGALATGAMLFNGKADDYKIAGVMMAAILIIYLIKRPTAEQIRKLEGD